VQNQLVEGQTNVREGRRQIYRRIWDRGGRRDWEVKEYDHFIMRVMNL